MKIDPVRRPAAQLHRPEQPGAVALLRATSAQRIGVHTCPGGDRDSTHSADVDYAELLPSLFELQGRQLLHRARRRAGPRARAEDHPPAHEARPAGLRRRRRADRSARRDAPRRCATACSRRREYIPLEQLGHDRRLRLLAVLRRHVDDAATRRSRRSARACSGTGAGGRDARSALMADADDDEDAAARRSRCRTPAASCSRASAPRRSCSGRKEALRESEERLRAMLRSARPSGSPIADARRPLHRRERQVLGRMLGYAGRRAACASTFSRRSSHADDRATSQPLGTATARGSDSDYSHREALSCRKDGVDGRGA